MGDSATIFEFVKATLEIFTYNFTHTNRGEWEKRQNSQEGVYKLFF